MYALRQGERGFRASGFQGLGREQELQGLVFAAVKPAADAWLALANRVVVACGPFAHCAVVKAGGDKLSTWELIRSNTDSCKPLAFYRYDGGVQQCSAEARKSFRTSCVLCLICTRTIPQLCGGLQSYKCAEACSLHRKSRTCGHGCK